MVSTDPTGEKCVVTSVHRVVNPAILFGQSYANIGERFVLIRNILTMTQSMYNI